MNGGGNYPGGPPNPMGGGSGGPGPGGMHGGSGSGPPLVQQGSPSGGPNYNMQGPAPASQPFNDISGQQGPGTGFGPPPPQQQQIFGGGRPQWGGHGYGIGRMGLPYGGGQPSQQQDNYGGGYVGQQGGGVSTGFGGYGGGYAPQAYYNQAAGQSSLPYAFAGTPLSPSFGPYSGRHPYGSYQQAGGYNDYYSSRAGYYVAPPPPPNPWGVTPPRSPSNIYGGGYGGYESYGPPPSPGPFGQYGGSYGGNMGPQGGPMGGGIMPPQGGGPSPGLFNGLQSGGVPAGLSNGIGPSGPMGSAPLIGEGSGMSGGPPLSGGFGPNISGRMSQNGPSGNFMGPMNFASGPSQSSNPASGGPNGNFPQKEKRSLNQPNSYYQYSVVSTYEKNHFVDRPLSNNFQTVRNLTKNSSMKKPSIGNPLCDECVPVDIEKFAGSWVQIFGNPASVKRILSKAIKHIISPVMSNPFFEYDAERENEDGQVSPSCLGYEFGLTNFSKNESPLIILFRKESNIRRLMQFFMQMVHATMIKSGNEFILQMQNFSQSRFLVVNVHHEYGVSYRKPSYNSVNGGPKLPGYSYVIDSQVSDSQIFTHPTMKDSSLSNCTRILLETTAFYKNKL
uniref:Uncharacterized protein n=1 Tax=Romanomermis culicivorax TaxID=13658 RepID=A0A915J9E5_ROMCU